MEDVRPCVREFAMDMENVLRENDHKTGWKNNTLDSLFRMMGREVEELEEEIDVFNNLQRKGVEVPEVRNAICREAIDIANFAMMIYDNAKGA
jgi:hypothetical protein